MATLTLLDPAPPDVDYTDVVCTACGVVNERSVQRIEHLDDDLHRLEVDFRKARARIAELEGERTRDLRTHKLFPVASRVLERWRGICMPRAKAVTSKTRLKPCLDRLEEDYTEEQLNLAVTGYGRFPFMVRGRRSAFGHETDRKVEAEFIFRTPQHVDRGIAMAYADMAGAPSAQALAKVPWSKVWRENHRLITAALKTQYGNGLRETYPIPVTMWPCPFCLQANPVPEAVAPLTLLVNEKVGGPIAECNMCGLTEDQLLAALVHVDGLL
jgi:hypothetical protein